MKLIFEREQAVVPVLGMDALFPVRRVYCVGRNYAAHAREMGANPDREAPFFFSKPADAVLIENNRLPYPSRTADLHHEVELVVALGKGGRNLTLQQAEEAVFGFAVGIDFTRRDLQAEAKQQGRPWDTAKGFDHSAPVSAITPVAAVAAAGNINTAQISLAVNGVDRQLGNISDLIWNINEVIAELSTYYRLKAGDLIFTGTPAGVSSVLPGDHIEARVEGLQPLQLDIVAEAS
ncbi:MAG: fumarylacetoacetate hydrolase family protein [Pseudomonadales bacterium]|nr:fumarylacetoacetate hydrolase family protein [Pseudomonadales bacterium]